ncbi:MAG: SagB/ThcOx family dehydrogenase [Candidatus Eisenbacteria bacterium]
MTNLDTGGDPVERILRYHDRTKHHFHGFARSLGYMDWANEPDPFRRYGGTPLVSLPLPEGDKTPPYDRIFEPRSAPDRPLDLSFVSELLFDSLAISAWKSFGGNTWALRVNPSSGNLHPTEGYLLAPAIEGLPGGPGVWHYAPKEHGLERRAEWTEETWGGLTDGFPEGTVFVALTSILWREAWKYGERAFRYCQHDIGHALAALRIAAAALGRDLRVLDGLSDEEIGALTGVDREADYVGGEREEPDLVAAIVPAGEAAPARMAAEAAGRAANAHWTGKANRLSAERAEWRVIDVAAEACRKRTETPLFDRAGTAAAEAASPIAAGKCRLFTTRGIVRRRRSAMAMDGETSIDRETFVRMLARTVPALCPVPWDSAAWPVSVHLGLFVHRVDGLDPGLYVLARDTGDEGALREAFREDFAWMRPEGVPGELPLFLLAPQDLRALSASVSCRQAIASDGAFSLAMLARFEEPIRERGAPVYRRLFWETGMIGQVLYLEAEAAGIRGTGIGCYFDEPVHEIFGLRGRAYQSLYHFTVGGPVEDPRLTTLPPYGDRQ